MESSLHTDRSTSYTFCRQVSKRGGGDDYMLKKRLVLKLPEYPLGGFRLYQDVVEHEIMHPFAQLGAFMQFSVFDGIETALSYK